MQKHWHKHINQVTTLNRGGEFPSTFFSSTQKIQAGKRIQHFQDQQQHVEAKKEEGESRDQHLSRKTTNKTLKMIS